MEKNSEEMDAVKLKAEKDMLLRCGEIPFKSIPVPKVEPAEPVAANQELELNCAHGCTNSQVAKQCPIHVVERIIKLVADSGPRVDTSLFPPKSMATDKVAAKKDSSRCSLDGAPRIPLNREGTKFGACMLVNGKDGTGGCKDPLHDYEIEQQAPTVEPQKVCKNCNLPIRKCDVECHHGCTFKGYVHSGNSTHFCFDVPNDQTCAEPPEDGSTRPERDQSNIDNEKLLDDMIERLRTRPEMPLASLWKTVPGKEQDDWGITEIDHAGSSIAQMMWQEDAEETVRLHNLAASVQQEPLSAGIEAAATEIYTEIEGFTPIGKKNFKANAADLTAINKITEILYRLKSTPAAPRKDTKKSYRETK